MSEEPPEIVIWPDEVALRDAAADRERRSLPIRVLDRVLSVQRPVVLTHIRGIRLRHPDATPEALIRILERRYLAAVTSGGAAVGATAVIPAVSTPVTLALAGAETAGFVECTALFAQSVAEVHGIPVADPDRARALVMTLMLGEEGTDLVQQFARQAMGKGIGRSVYWGEVLTTSMPRAVFRAGFDQLQGAFIRHFGRIGGASIVGKVIPFGIGAAIGGAGNHVLGRRVVKASRPAFGRAPDRFPVDLDPREGATPVELMVVRGALAGGRGIAAVTRRMAARGGRRADRSPVDEPSPEDRTTGP